MYDSSMDILHFLNHIKTNELVSFPIISFKGKDSYPLLFFSYLFNYINMHYPYPVSSFDLNDATKESVHGALDTYFLGEKRLCWFRNLSSLDAKKKHYWKTSLAHYCGPHQIAFFVDKEMSLPSNERMMVVYTPEFVNKQQFEQLVAFFNHNVSRSGKQLINCIFKKNNSVPLDTAMLLIQYVSLIGTGVDYFNNYWLDNLVIPEKSLFILSKYFFAKDKQLFFTYLTTIANNYSEIFWISFWSDLLWRACNFVQLSQENRREEAKKIGFRLPFSFITYDWKKANVTELSQAHLFLYNLDFNLKNGALTSYLELFYTKYFSHQFA